MTRIFLKALNAPLLLFLVCLGLAFQSSLFMAWPLTYFQPDITLTVIVWCSLRRRFTEGGILTLIIAEFAEIHSAAPQGLFLISDMLVYLGVRAASRYLVIPNRFSYAVITWGSSIATKLSGILILYLLGAGGNPWKHTLTFLFLGAAVEGAFSMWIFRALEALDWFTYKNLRSDRILEDELQLDSEGY